MTVFGWFYLVLTVYGVFLAINEVGKIRKPVTTQEAFLKSLSGALLFWGLYAWGLR